MNACIRYLLALPAMFACTGITSAYALPKDVPSSVCVEQLGPHLKTIAVSLRDGKFEVGDEHIAQPEINSADPSMRNRWRKAADEGYAWAAYNWARKDGVAIVAVQYVFENNTGCDSFPDEPVRISPIYLPRKIAEYLVSQQGGKPDDDLGRLRGQVQHILSQWTSEPDMDEGEDYHNAPNTQTASNESSQPMTFNGAAITVLKGSCEKLVIGKKNYSDSCSGDLMSTAYPDRRVGFYFGTKQNQMFTFSGLDGENPNSYTDITHVDKVIINLKGKENTAKEFAASGQCMYGNPYNGPSTVTCSGNIKDGRKFSAIFITDGSPPR